MNNRHPPVVSRHSVEVRFEKLFCRLSTIAPTRCSSCPQEHRSSTVGPYKRGVASWHSSGSINILANPGEEYQNTPLPLFPQVGYKLTRRKNMPCLMLYIIMYTVAKRELSGDDENYPRGDIRGVGKKLCPMMSSLTNKRRMTAGQGKKAGPKNKKQS